MADQVMSAKHPFVVYWNNIPSPYMVERFNCIASRGKFEFEAWFNERTESDRSWNVLEETWKFRYRYLSAGRFGRRRYHLPTPILGRRPDVLISLYSQPSFVTGWLIAYLRGSKTCFRVLATHDAWVARNSAKELAKHVLFRLVDGIETPGEDGRRYAMKYGATANKIFLATHTVDLAHFQRLARQTREAERDLKRNVLGLSGCVFLYVGRLWSGKGIDVLLDAFKKVLRATGEATTLLLVGDGKQEFQLRERCRLEGIRNVVFAGFKHKPELPEYFALADVFVFPTLGDPYGLVVDEAMACSLPVISTSAAGEIASRVTDYENGFVVPPANADSLARRMIELSGDSNLRERMGRNSRHKVSTHTVDNWANSIETMVASLLD